MEQKRFDVTGMTCSACSAAVEKSVRKLDGISNVTVSLMTNTMTVAYDEDVTEDSVIEAVKRAGYGAQVHNKKGAAQSVTKANPIEDELKEMKTRLIVSTVFLIPLLYIAMGYMVGLPVPGWLVGPENAISFAFIQMLLSMPIAYVNRKYFSIGFKALWLRSPNMDSLIAIGASAAFLYGIYAIFRTGYGLGHNEMHIVHNFAHDLYFEVGATILTLITFGKFLETRSKGKTSEAISKLMDLAPKTALVVRNDMEMEVPIDEVIIGDIVVVKPGKSVPVDGTIVEGSSSVDQSALTGESIPVEKSAGDKVIAATINKTGYFRFRAEKVGDDTTLAKIIQLVEDANATKAPIAKLADKISGIFVPTVIAIAIVTFIVWISLGYSFEFALSLAITVLVISCPCALGLATPVAIMVGTGKGAQHGILVKSAEALETMHSINTVVLDKTGTITEGKPVVTDIITDGNISEEELILIGASIEKPSEHPLAEAIVEKAKEMNITLKKVENFNSVSGMGIAALIDGKPYIAGNLKLMNEENIVMGDFQEISDRLANEGKTPLFFGTNEKVLGIIAVADVVKKNSKQAIELFKKMGIDVVMLTGDNKRTAEAIRRQLNIDRVVAEVLPQDKEREIREIQATGHKVAMIGDGINDAPALTRADVGVAIGAGTDIAIESADIVLIKNDLLDAVTAVQLSRATIKNIKQNLFWAFFYNVLGIPVAAGVFYIALGWRLSPMFAAAAMSISSVFVVTNALRLKFFQPLHEKNRPVTE
ncbi:heavy metal translocating P-type ATPase [Proteiniclasticum sp.]|uniref:heavy metal translocating P-type ATPase n=1 Tax=Proteiniclasticum sp. TaxID=2053595 RepID=UPI002897CF1A|nr:heavy metal translocating P-type ATPase [Proteiniclasticum sp.]